MLHLTLKVIISRYIEVKNIQANNVLVLDELKHFFQYFLRISIFFCNFARKIEKSKSVSAKCSHYISRRKWKSFRK